MKNGALYESLGMWSHSIPLYAVVIPMYVVVVLLCGIRLFGILLCSHMVVVMGLFGIRVIYGTNRAHERRQLVMEEICIP